MKPCVGDISYSVAGCSCEDRNDERINLQHRLVKTPKVSQAETAKTLFPQLAEENQQVQELLRGYGKSISGIEVSLRQIGLHVSAWHRFAGGQDDNIGYCWSRDIGYTHINDRWHIAVREWSQEVGREDEQTVYKFSEAPPWLCLEAAGKIAGLLREANRSHARHACQPHQKEARGR